MLTVFIANIDLTYPRSLELLKLGAVSVASSMMPGCRIHVDKTMKEIFIKHLKSHGGSSISGITMNYAAYRKWVLTTDEWSQYLAAILAMVDMHKQS